MKPFMRFFQKKVSFMYVVGTILLVLLLNTVWFIFLYQSALDAFIQKKAAEYPFIDFSRHFISQDNYIVNIQPLREELRNMSQEFSGLEREVSLYLEFLNTGANISINPDNYIWPASLTKVPLAMAVMKKVEDGDWELHNELVLMPGDADTHSGAIENPLADFPVGTRFTIETLLREVLMNSDNTAYYILLRNLHRDDLNKMTLAIGLDALFQKDGKISAKEYSRILRSLYTASFLSRAHSQMILEWLDEATFNSFLTEGVPESVPFPHKYGEDDRTRVYSDSGIVYLPDRPYIISVMVQANPNAPYASEQEAVSVFMEQVSRAAYGYLSQVQNE